MEKIAFDDIPAIEKHISEDCGPFGNTYEVSQEKINAFAELTGDHQWIHIDVERCKKESPFGGPIAHGFLTLSLLPFLRAGGDDPFGSLTSSYVYYIPLHEDILERRPSCGHIHKQDKPCPP